MLDQGKSYNSNLHPPPGILNAFFILNRLEEKVEPIEKKMNYF